MLGEVPVGLAQETPYSVLANFNPQLAALDMRPLWTELGLPYQGLESDPSNR